METTRLKPVIIFAIVFVLLSTVANNAKAQSTRKLLQAHVWEQQFPSRQTFLITKKFNGTMLIIKFEMGDKKITDNSKYYLSDTIETTFNADNVGKKGDGKYIIVDETRKKSGILYKHLGVFEIITLDAENLILKNHENMSTLVYKPLK